MSFGGRCTKQIHQECALHPVDCPNCVHKDKCQMRETMQAYPEIIKRCKFFKRRK